MLGITSMKTDEACLYLNVWTPAIAPRAKLPVLLWIHGGGNVEGAAGWPPLGETLAQQGIVVVSINYRLGIFGYFASAELSAESPQHVSGNYGQLDQLAALHWVRRNIAHFGGDPSRITVAGQSSGSEDICNLMASPLSTGLFERVILQSGVCVDGIFPSLHQAEASNNSLAKALGASSKPASLAGLRSIPAARLFEAAAADRDLDIEPVVDGRFLPAQPATLFAQGKQAKVAVLVGSNDNEVSIFASPLVGGKSYRPQTLAEYHQWLNRKFGSLAGDVFAAYPAQTDADVLAAFNTMYSDYDFGFGARLLAQESTRIGQPVFLYHFTYTGQGLFASLGAFHSEENMFLSKKYWTTWIRTPDDDPLSNAIIAYWTNFVKTGDPNSPALPAWPAYDPKQDLCQRLGRTIAPEPVPRSADFWIFQKYLDGRLANLHNSD
jgi:para-nitrobenzyl esterase